MIGLLKSLIKNMGTTLKLKVQLKKIGIILHVRKQTYMEELIQNSMPNQTCKNRHKKWILSDRLMMRVTRFYPAC